MKQVILILSVILSVLVCSCSDEISVDTPQKESNGKCSVTFNLSKDSGSDFEMATKSSSIIPIPEEYSVMFYLFKEDGNDYKLIRGPEIIKSSVLTLDNLTEDAEYRYVFVAIHNPTQDESIAKVLKALDFGTTKMTPDEWTITPPSEASTTNNSLLENCFLELFPALTYEDNEVVTIEKDMDIFGAGSYFLPGSITAAIGVTLERQIGVVEFKYEDAAVGDKLECSFSSDYYRLYLSQMVKDKNNMNYTSENSAKFPVTVSDAGGKEYTTGDYYTISYVFCTNNQGLPTFKKTKILTGTENSIKVYMPYTTSATIGSKVDDKYKANCIRTGVIGDSSSPIGDITLNITKADGSSAQSFKKAGTFPIYRNGKTVFTTVGSEYLSVNFGNNTDDGIHLPDDDKWNGDN